MAKNSNMSNPVTTPESAVAIARAIEAERFYLDSLILRTPTGATRNLLTEANIHIMHACHVLKGASK